MTIGINVTYDIKDVNSLTIKDGSLNINNSSIYINNVGGSSGQILQINSDNKLGWADLDSIEGTTGEQGVGISSTLDNGDGTFTFNYTNGTTFTTSDLTGPQGDNGIIGVDLSLSYLDVSNIANINYLIVNNDLTVNGTTYTVHHQDITISDETITLASNLTNSTLLTQFNYAGIEISNIAYLKYYNSSWKIESNLDISGYLKVNDVDVATINSNNLINYTISSELYSKDDLKSGNLDLSFQNIDISGSLVVDGNFNLNNLNNKVSLGIDASDISINIIKATNYAVCNYEISGILTPTNFNITNLDNFNEGAQFIFKLRPKNNNSKISILGSTLQNISVISRNLSGLMNVFDNQQIDISGFTNILNNQQIDICGNNQIGLMTIMRLDNDIFTSISRYNN